MEDNELVPVETPDWDEPGALTILLQGGIFPSNIVDIANHCVHWRQLFPAAQIVLAGSTTDILAGTSADGKMTSVQLVRAFATNGPVQAALRAIERNCDVITVADGDALPLPAIKLDSPGPNNVNLQIAAAKSGLAQATGRYVLRVRSDLVFRNRGFLDQLIEARSCPRGAAARFSERVLISPLFTLNPYTFERMPLHFSDWFHFGLTQDVRRIWAVPPMTFADSIYYAREKHADHSNLDEKLVLTRLAVEQHLIFECFRHEFPDLTLNYHNDPSSIELSVDILADNFVICDLIAAQCVFSKYGSDFTNPRKRIHCILQDDWKSLVALEGEERRHVLSRKAAWASAPEEEPFPRHYDAYALQTADGLKVHDEIVSRPGGGFLMFGPYTAVPPGKYLATILTGPIADEGVFDLRVTTGRGRKIIAACTIQAKRWGRKPLEIPFEVVDDNAADLEVTCQAAGVRSLVIKGLTIDRNDRWVPGRYFLVSSSELRTTVGRSVEAGTKTNFTAGMLMFGPWISVEPGLYRVTLELEDIRALDDVRFEITSNDSEKKLLTCPVTMAEIERETFETLLSIGRPEERVEFRMMVDDTSDFIVRGVGLDPIAERD